MRGIGGHKRGEHREGGQQSQHGCSRASALLGLGASTKVWAHPAPAERAIYILVHRVQCKKDGYRKCFGCITNFNELNTLLYIVIIRQYDSKMYLITVKVEDRER